MSSPFDDLRVAVVHDWLTGQRGGEHVLEGILELVPHAEIFTLFHFPGSVSSFIESHPIHVSSLQRVASKISNYRMLLPFFPGATADWNLAPFDLVISSSHAVAKGVRVPGVHVSYCHTPMRYVWDRFDDYFPPGRPLRRLAGSVVAAPLREWDRRTAMHVDAFAANSAFVAERIRRYYGREAHVIHPFVADRFFEREPADGPRTHHLAVSALVPYKRLDLAIDAARALGEPLVIVGRGTDEAALRARASGADVTFRGWVSDAEVESLIRGAKSFLIPGVEDFGITALEAMACGTPVLGVTEGGVRESVVEGRTGLLVEPGDARALAEAMREAGRRTWDRGALRTRAAQFRRRRFLDEFRTLIEGVLAGHGRGTPPHP